MEISLTRVVLESPKKRDRGQKPLRGDFWADAKDASRVVGIKRCTGRRSVEEQQDELPTVSVSRAKVGRHSRSNEDVLAPTGF